VARVVYCNGEVFVMRIESVRLKGWKSFADATLELRAVNILIGGNGAGKSNLLGFFDLLKEVVENRLQRFVSKVGGAETCLHFGRKRTRAIVAEVAATNGLRYSLCLEPTETDNFVITEEAREWPTAPPGLMGDRLNGHESMSMLLGWAQLGHPEAKSMLGLLKGCYVYHLHDTSPSSPMRRGRDVEDNRRLYGDGANLAAMLYLYREKYPIVYRRVRAAVRAVATYFDDFVLDPSRLQVDTVALRWRSIHSEYVFGTHQLSDGTLRMIALATLLLQPEADYPALILLDEPELGLHPAALAILADLIKLASRRCQILAGTQSGMLLDHFAPEDIVAIDQRDGSSTFRRLDAEDLKDWLEDYSVSDLWAKNVIGGGPYG